MKFMSGEHYKILLPLIIAALALPTLFICGFAIAEDEGAQTAAESARVVTGAEPGKAEQQQAKAAKAAEETVAAEATAAAVEENTEAAKKDFSKAVIVNRSDPEPMPEGTVRLLFDIRSPSMKRDINVAVVLPPAYEAEKERRFAVLYAMHGMGAPYKTYTDMPTLRRATLERPFIIVTFNGDKAGWYIDSTVQSQSQFTTFFFDELIPVIDANFRTRATARSRGTTGFSMGGYGSMQYMLTRPEMIGSASALSGAFSFLGERSGKPHASVAALLGRHEANSDAYARWGIYNRIESYVADRKPLPPMYIHCGSSDFLIEENRALAAFLMKQNELLRKTNAGYSLDFQYHESIGGHTWKFWMNAAAAVADFHWRVFQTDK